MGLPEVGVSEEGEFAARWSSCEVKTEVHAYIFSEDRHEAFITISLFVCNQFILMLKL